MSLTGLGEPVFVLSPGTAHDPYSDTDVEVWELPPGGAWVTGRGRVPVEDVLVEPRPSSEPVQDARNATVTGYTLYLPAGTVLTSHSRVEVRGVEHTVLGGPADWRLGDWRPGLVVQTGRVDG